MMPEFLVNHCTQDTIPFVHCVAMKGLLWPQRTTDFTFCKYKMLKSVIKSMICSHPQTMCISICKKTNGTECSVIIPLTRRFKLTINQRKHKCVWGMCNGLPYCRLKQIHRCLKHIRHIESFCWVLFSLVLQLLCVTLHISCFSHRTFSHKSLMHMLLLTARTRAEHTQVHFEGTEVLRFQ